MNDYVEIFTDGAVSGNQFKENYGGWGFCITYKGVTKEFCDGAINTTNNKMELQAVIEALKVMKIKDIPVKVYMDSNYVLQGVTKWVYGWKKRGWTKSNKKPVENKEQWIELDALRNQYKDIEFIKVKGHSGEIGNELADQLANKGIQKAKNGEL